MSTHDLPWHPSASVLDALPAIAAAVRAPTGLRQTPTTLSLDFTPDLTAPQLALVQGVVAELVARADAPVTLTAAEWAAIRPQVQSLRDLRQLGRNAFMALTAAERDRALYDAQTATTIILLAILRE